jgi:hypothetical protein
MTSIAKISAPTGADRVIGVRVWASLANVSYSTAKWLLAHGKGPKVTRLSPHRIDIRLSHHHEWLDARAGRTFEHRADELPRGRR